MKVLVYGATGSQSSPIVWQLLQQGHQPYVFTRHPQKAEAMHDAGAHIIEGDMSNPADLNRASQGMDAVALQIPFFLPNPADAIIYARNTIDAAKAAGVKLIVWNTSGPIIEGRSGNPAFDVRNDIADYLEASGVPYIIIQPTAYMENWLGPWTRPAVVERDILSYPVDDETRNGWIATEDVASFVVAALERPHLANATFVVSGMENANGPELAQSFSKALGRPITYNAMPLPEFGAILDAAFGPGAGEGAIQAYEFQRTNGDRMRMYTDMGPVLEKLPVKMTSIEEWAKKHHQAFSKFV